MHGTNGNRMLWLTAAAAVAASAIPASAEVYLTESQALGVVLGDKAVVRREQKQMDGTVRKRLEDASGLRFPESSATFFIAAQDGKPSKYAIVINEIGKSEPITFLVGMSLEGKVTEVVIMEFRENRGWEVREKRFLSQFRGKTARSAIRVDEDIINYAGATLSSKAVARGVKRALLLLDAFYPGESRFKLSAAREFAFPAPLKPLTTVSTNDGALGLYKQIRCGMGTYCEIRVWSASAGNASALFAKGFAEIERIEQIFSAYRDDSELSYVNRYAAEDGVKISDEFFEVTRRSVDACREHLGAINFAVGPLVDLWRNCEREQRWPTQVEMQKAKQLADIRNVALRSSDSSVRFRIPGTKLDFGGMAKGYAAEKIGRLLTNSGAVSGLVSLGGSSLHAMATHAPPTEDGQGRPPSNETNVWPVAIQHPGERARVVRTLLMNPGESLSTSGTTERGFAIRGERLSHILDPNAGHPLRGVRTASAVSLDGIRAEAISKTLLLTNRSTFFQFFRQNNAKDLTVG